MHNMHTTHTTQHARTHTHTHTEHMQHTHTQHTHTTQHTQPFSPQPLQVTVTLLPAGHCPGSVM